MPSFTTRPELAGTYGAVASTHWIPSAVGMKVLEAGGNAFDAAIAAGFVLQVVQPHLVGPAGDASILIARGNDSEPTVVCGQGGAPSAATLQRFEQLGLEQIPGTGSLAACVPGAFGAWLTILRDWGTISLRDALAPAIGYAAKGYPIHFDTVEAIRSVQALYVKEWTTSADLYLPGGEPPAVDSLFKNPALGRLYESIVRHAEAASGNREAQIEAALAYWYEGPVAEVMSEFLRSTEVYDVSGRHHRGLLTPNDMSGWRPQVEAAVGVDYRDHRVFKCGAWSQGPSMLQALKILENDDIGALGDEGPEFVHLVTETIKLVMADRDAWYGDSPDVPLKDILSDAYAKERRALITQQASLDLRPGSPGGRAPSMPRIGAPTPHGQPLRAGEGGGEPTFAKTRAKTDSVGIRGDTVHLDVIDRWGNMVSATPSGGWLQSNPVIPDLGFPMGTRMQMFVLEPGHTTTLAPGKRPRTTLTPSMVFRDGRPYLAFGTPGGDQQEQWSLSFLLRHLDHKQGLQRAIDAPAFHTDHLVSSFWPRAFAPGGLVVEDRLPEATTKALGDWGHDVTLGPPWSEGWLSACSYDGLIMRAAANPRGMQGYAVVR
ncbi:MAG: gamma-glutamyltransferase [Bradyrhizobium sp.]|nr:gamma-glutamyltransferase [Bradyrhizobium sp.]